MSKPYLELFTELDEITRRLRKECPWDRKQNERSIVPHTVGEAYELADAVLAGDDEKTVDELGDVLFQVYFLALLLEERGRGDLAAVAEGIKAKLIRRHPHVFGETEVEGVEDVRRNWDQIKSQEVGRESGVFAEIPAYLSSLLLALKVQRRAKSADVESVQLESPESLLVDELSAAQNSEDTADSFVAVGDLLFNIVSLARKTGVDPELALRAACDRFRQRAQNTYAGEETDMEVN